MPGSPLLLIAALTLIRWPVRVSGDEPVFRPNGLTPVRVLVDGTVERVGVREGGRVRRGDAARRAPSHSAGRGAGGHRRPTRRRRTGSRRSPPAGATPAEERLHRIRGDALRRELALLDEELELTTVRAPADGMVLTPRLEERIGTSLAEGDELLTIGRVDTLELEFGVDQRDILRVRPGQEIRLRVDALPSRTFEGRVSSIAQLPRERDGRVQYAVRASVPNTEGMLKGRDGRPCAGS